MTLDQQIKGLKETRAEKTKGLDALADKAIAENRALNADEQKSYDAIGVEVKGIDSQLNLLIEKDNREKAAAKLAGTYHPGASTETGSEQRELNKIGKEYSMKSAFSSGFKGKPLEGLEREMSDHLRAEMESSGCELQPGSMIVPAQAFRSNSQRTVSMDATTATAAPNNEGSYTIQTNVEGVVDVLLPMMTLGKVPLMRMNNLKGNVQFPQAQTLPSAGWNTENGSATQKSPKLAKLNLSPKRQAAYIDLSNQLLIQSETNIRAYTNNFLVQAAAIDLEKACLKGGGSNEITGIIGGTGYNTVYAGGGIGQATNGAVMVWADWVNLVKSAYAANSFNGQAYITSPAQLGRAQITPRQASGVEGNFILPSWNSGVNGFPAYATTNMVDTYSSGSSANLSAIIFGDFTKAVLGSWGGIEINVDPYTGLKTGVTTMVLNAYVDFGMLIPSAFSVCKDLRP